MASVYSYDQDEVWKRAAIAARKAVEDAQTQIAGWCEKAGHSCPLRSLDKLFVAWTRSERCQGDRRAELRAVAKSRIAPTESRHASKCYASTRNCKSLLMG